MRGAKKAAPDAWRDTPEGAATWQHPDRERPVEVVGLEAGVTNTAPTNPCPKAPSAPPPSDPAPVSAEDALRYLPLEAVCALVRNGGAL